jgi:hypothetical protein
MVPDGNTHSKVGNVIKARVGIVKIISGWDGARICDALAKLNQHGS